MAMEQAPGRLLDKVRQAIRLKHYLIPTQQAYIHWTKRFILCHSEPSALEMGKGEQEIIEVLSHVGVVELKGRREELPFPP
jgi:hypothetical protein